LHFATLCCGGVFWLGRTNEAFGRLDQALKQRPTFLVFCVPYHPLSVALRRGYRFVYPVDVGAHTPWRTPLRILRWAAALLLAAIAAALGIWILQRTKETPEAELVPTALTSYPGYEAYPSFSPDGTQVAFQWCTQEPSANCDIYVKQIGVEPPSRLTIDPAEDFSPAWSPDGKFIAFLRKVSTSRTALMLIPQRGGQERVLGEGVKALEPTHPEAGWTVGKQGIYFFTPQDRQGRSDICLYKFATGKISKILRIERAVYDRIAVSPDERTILCGQYDQAGSDLMLVENFRQKVHQPRVSKSCCTA
jgi:dipeptidyl aminopeptidase/acylaminoacyl peptidase